MRTPFAVPPLGAREMQQPSIKIRPNRSAEAARIEHRRKADIGACRNNAMSYLNVEIRYRAVFASHLLVFLNDELRYRMCLQALLMCYLNVEITHRIIRVFVDHNITDNA